MEYKLNAAHRVLGRLASEIALLLRGKDTARFDPAKIFHNRVTVLNTDKMRVTGKKMDQKLYRRHSGFHGGLKEKTLKEVWQKDSREALRRAVLGMLPKNRLRARMIKNLILKKGE